MCAGSYGNACAVVRVACRRVADDVVAVDAVLVAPVALGGDVDTDEGGDNRHGLGRDLRRICAFAGFVDRGDHVVVLRPVDRSRVRERGRSNGDRRHVERRGPGVRDLHRVGRCRIERVRPERERGRDHRDARPRDRKLRVRDVDGRPVPRIAHAHLGQQVGGMGNHRFRREQACDFFRMKSKPDMSNDLLISPATQCSARSRNQHGPHRAIRAVPDANIRRPNVQPHFLSHLHPKLCHSKNIILREFPSPRLLRPGIANRQFGRIALQQVDSFASRAAGTCVGAAPRQRRKNRNEK